MIIALSVEYFNALKPWRDNVLVVRPCCGPDDEDIVPPLKTYALTTSAESSAGDFGTVVD